MNKQHTTTAITFVISTLDRVYMDFEPGEYWLADPEGQHDLELGYCITIYDLAEMLFEVHEACTGPDHTLDGWTLYMDGEE